MAEYIVIVTLDDSGRFSDLDQSLVNSLFDTTMEPQPATAFVLPRGVYRVFSETTAGDVLNAVALHLHRLEADGSVLVLEKADTPVACSGHARHDPAKNQPVRH